MSDLKQEISKNIKLVYDNEKSFINEFAKNEVVQISEVYGFYMGSDCHLVKFGFACLEVSEVYISETNFDLWKSNIKESNNE